MKKRSLETANIALVTTPPATVGKEPTVNHQTRPKRRGSKPISTNKMPPLTLSQILGTKIGRIFVGLVLVFNIIGGGGVSIVIIINVQKQIKDLNTSHESELKNITNNYEIKFESLQKELNTITKNYEQLINSVQSLRDINIHIATGNNQIMEPRQEEVTTTTPVARIKYSDIPGSDKDFSKDFSKATNSPSPKKSMFELRDRYKDPGQSLEALLCSQWLHENEIDKRLAEERLKDMKHFTKLLQDESGARFKYITAQGVVLKPNGDVLLQTTDGINDPDMYFRINVSIE